MKNVDQKCYTTEWYMLANNDFLRKTTHPLLRHTLVRLSHVHLCHSRTRMQMLSPLLRAASLICRVEVQSHSPEASVIILQGFVLNLYTKN